ncbi:tripartite tricarboxylate transporter substrate binding protein [Polaromonas sp. JS666]|uniref:Bug family tripartite tricarboxylate transporter substrate binding protein n=1 Tax=Polaromonas sp. (strain JS666 / ATCC BAA-500) TaxID=296591 RepID=UPI000882E08B|nr:tripartite tricarboxylate transporter substrate binding protein [Polaromonas sp. JS666]SDN31682.1 Tripartite-type tricarboxylate transporter, receptor component TctC [Polaromonas sp. JS666]
MKRRLLNQFALLGAGALLSGVAHAQSDKPISLVVGYSAGGSADLVARVVGTELSKRLGRQFIVENVAGASGMIAAQKVLSAPADGNIVYMGGTDTVLVPMVNPKTRLDWEKDLLPIGRMTTVPLVFAVPSGSPYTTLSDLVSALRKSGKESFNYATPGIATMQHIYGSLINKQAKVEMLHIPYRGGAQIANDLVGGQVDSAVLVLSTAMPFLKDGKIKALSVSDSARVAQLPNVKRIGEEEGFNGISLPLWQGLFVKSGTSPATVAAYEKALLQALAQPEVRAKLADAGITVAPMTGREMRAFVGPQAALYRDIVKTAKITME